jgi:hypothetical protein
LGPGIADAPSSRMLLALVPGLVAVALFVATLTMNPQRRRGTLLPPAPRRS